MTDRNSGSVADGRNSDGTFAAGNPGRPKGTRLRATRAEEELLEGEVEKLSRKAIDMALEGDIAAIPTTSAEMGEQAESKGKDDLPDKHPSGRRALRFERTEEGIVELKAQSEAQLIEAVGATTREFAEFVAISCGELGVLSFSRDENTALDIVAEIAPENPIEALLATQMAAVHLSVLQQAKHMANAEYIPQMDAAERTLNKLARTFNSQVETLRKLRGGGEQKMTVEHVTVNDGGQAIVGSVSKGGGRGGD